MRKLYVSLSGLLGILLETEMDAWQDDPNTFYFFGCTKEGVDSTFDTCDRKNILNRGKIVSILESAERDGRLCWRHGRDLQADIDWMHQVLGVPTENIRKMCECGFFTLPAMERYFSNVPDIKFIWNYWRQKE
jgi:hypothetical protein